MGTNTHPQRDQRPVFVDVSGRRRRTLRVAGGIVILPTVCYVMVLLIAVLVGPAIQQQALPPPLLPLAAAAVFPSEEQRPINLIWNGLARPSVEAMPTNPATTGAASSAAGFGEASVLASRTLTPSPTHAAERKPALQSAPSATARPEPAVWSAPPSAAKRKPAMKSTPFRAAGHRRDEVDESNDDDGGDAKSRQRPKHRTSSAKRSR